MRNKITSYLNLFDIIGSTPQLYIFNNKRYKSILSSIISIFIILFSIGFAIISLIDYLKYETPNIAYSKDNDEKTERSLLLKDSILAFQLVDAIDTFNFNIVNNSFAYYLANFSIFYNNGTMDYKLINIENCEFGKNLNLKYKELFDNRTTYGRSLEELYCLNTQDTNLSLFYEPSIGFSILTLYIVFKNNTIYTPERLQTLIINENNIIDHSNKNSPINKGYYFVFTGAYSTTEFTKINYNLKYIKYDSDEGLFFKKNKPFKGISYSEMVSYRNSYEGYRLNTNFQETNTSIIGAIVFVIDQSNFDSYKRTYQRLQSLLAEVMSVVNLLIEIARQISNILCNKNMNKDIIEYLFNKYKKTKNNKLNKLIKKQEGKDVISERKEIIDRPNKIYNNENIENNNEIKIEKTKKKENFSIIKNVKIKVHNTTFNRINYFHILKSFLCFKDKKTKLINLCHKIITEDMCIETILERFLYLENICHYNLKERKEKSEFLKKNNIRFKEIIKYLYTTDGLNKDNCPKEEIKNANNENDSKKNSSIKYLK